MERSDRELLRQCRLGDKGAFEELVERYQRKVMAVALGMVRNPDDAMEITQDAFVKAYENIASFKGESSFYTWIYRIVVNKAIDLRRRQRRKPTVALEDRGRQADRDDSWEDSLADEGPIDPYERTRSMEMSERMQEAIDELTPDHKAVIVLREVEGLSYEEISRVMRCSKGTVMSRLHYARKKLQNRLKDLV